ncbi:MAG: spermidine/putrescine ABC transporter substrate-binding protein [Acidimicrobiia bacterium]|nr:spermidine/putrescine ABC transporter substrate-binding protein [Acidimicrobiia bacterium]
MTGRPIGHRRLSRRRFLAGMGAAGLGAVGLGACSSVADRRTYDLGDGSRLRMLNWAEYIDSGGPNDDDPYYAGGTLATLADEGLQVDYVEDYLDNIDGFRKVIDEAVTPDVPEWDIVVPTNWRAAEMIANKWAEPLPIEIIPNHVNIDPAYLTNSWDRGCRFQMPWQAGITGIAYDPALTGRPLTSVSDLLDPAFAGRVGFIGEMREAVGLMMLANGDDPSRPTRAAADAALDDIADAAASGQVGAFTFNEFADLLAAGDLVAAMAWSGDVAILQNDRPDITFVIPEEGAVQWFDTMVIPRGSQALAAAGRFMNYVYDPVNAARITEWVSYISPVMGVQEELLRRGGASAELAASTVLFPDETTRNRLFTWGGLDSADEEALDERYAALVEGS